MMGRFRLLAMLASLRYLRRIEWWNERSAPALQAVGLLAVFLFLSKDVERTLNQKPMSPEQMRQLTAAIEEREKR
ncbi:MAG: hypothetical protein SGPRY_010621 [Prymnesium sp.]